jgi:hypothetical protein
MVHHKSANASPAVLLERQARPTALLPTPEHLPTRLTEGNVFVVWNYWFDPDRQKWTKPPRSALTGQKTDATDLASGVDFAAALAAMHRRSYDGIGRMLFRDDHLVGWDLDHCRNAETGEIADWAMELVEELNSFTEISPSGTGLRILTNGEIEPDGKKFGDIEVYCGGRYLTLTGHHLEGTPKTVKKRQEQIDRVFARCFPPKVKPERPNPIQPATPINRDTEAILARVLRTNKGRRLHDDGDWTGLHYSSQSEADQGLCNLFTAAGADRGQADDLFRRSALMREKWGVKHHSDGRTYGEGTIDKSFDGSVPLWPDDAPATATLAFPALSLLPADAPCVAQVHALREALAASAQRVVDLEAENAQLRADSTTLINLVINPHLRGKAPTVIRAASSWLQQQRTGKIDDDGFGLMSHVALADDFENVDHPILARATVSRHLNALAQARRPDGKPLLELVKRSEPTDVVARNRNGQPIIDQETGKPKTNRLPVERTWARFTGNSLAEILRPFAFFRPTESEGSATDDAPPTYGYGGDRRSAKFQAARTPCPDCGSTERHTFCKGCGVDISLVVEKEDRARFQFETREMPDKTAPNFQDVTPENEYPTVGGGSGFQLEIRENQLVNAPQDSIAREWLRPKPVPGLQGEPGIDRWTS